MAESPLTSATPLGGYGRDFGGTRLSEVPDVAVITGAIPQGAEDRVARVLEAAFGATLPAPGRYTTSPDGTTRVLARSPDQVVFLFPSAGVTALRDVQSRTGDVLWLTDQSDAHCTLEIAGPEAREALARICPLDLDASVFGADHASRTLMEHLTVTILRVGDDRFWLLSARSSARDFLRAVERSLENVCTPG